MEKKVAAVSKTVDGVVAPAQARHEHVPTRGHESCEKSSMRRKGRCEKHT